MITKHAKNAFRPKIRIADGVHYKASKNTIQIDYDLISQQIYDVVLSGVVCEPIVKLGKKTHFTGSLTKIQNAQPSYQSRPTRSNAPQLAWWFKNS